MANTSTPFPGPDAPPASAGYLPEPDAPSTAGATVVKVPVRTVRQPAAREAAPQQHTTVGSSSSTPAVSERVSTRPTRSVGPPPVIAVKRATRPAATGGAAVATKATPNPKPAAAKKAAATQAAPAPVRSLGPADPPGRDRGLLALAGVLLGVAAIGGAVLGEGFRHAFRERHP